MSNLKYFDLRIPAPRRLAMMRRDFAEHGAKFPRCPERARPESWRDVRRYGMNSYAAAFGLSDSGWSEDSRGRRVPILYAFEADSLPVRRIRDAQEIADMRHSGWYCDDDCGELCIGIVASLTHGRFLAGWRLTDNGEHILHADLIFDDESDAASYADSLAESYAEREREYQARYREAKSLDEKISADLESLSAERRALRDAIEDRASARASFATIADRAADRASDRAARARAQAAELIARIRANREKREEIQV